jgi:membrane protein implicated in regulation of membrane protease activity
MIGEQILWAAIIILAIVIEALTTGMVSIWFVPGAIASLILTLFKAPFALQLVAFIVLSAVCIFLFKFVFKGTEKKKGAKLNLEAIIGEKGIVVDRIHNLAGSGQVKVCNQVWSARSADPEKTFEVGEVISVVAIEGVKLICK